MKTVSFINIVLIIVIVVGIYFIISELNPKPKDNIIIQRDTINHVDTVRVPKLIYIKNLQAKIDTIFIDSSKVLAAHADTIFQKDSSEIKISYYYPPKNFFEIALDLKEKIIHELKTITEIKTITIEQPWYEDTWFYTTIISIAILFLVR